MKCPKCGRVAKITPDEKALVKRFGSLKKMCTCTEVFTVYLYDVDPLSAKQHRIETGICTACGKGKATDGYLTCERCRAAGAREREWTKALPMYEKKREKAQKYTLDELSKMAHDMGISYGDLSAILEGRLPVPKKE